jgi:hypothetical protein
VKTVADPIRALRAWWLMRWSQDFGQIVAVCIVILALVPFISGRF